MYYDLCMECDKVESTEDISINIKFFTGCSDEKNISIFYNLSNEKCYQISRQMARKRQVYTHEVENNFTGKKRCFIAHNIIT